MPKLKETDEYKFVILHDIVIPAGTVIYKRINTNPNDPEYVAQSSHGEFSINKSQMADQRMFVELKE